MDSHDHNHDGAEDESLRPKGTRLDKRPAAAMWAAAAAGRTDVLGQQEMLRLQRAVGNSGVRRLVEQRHAVQDQAVGRDEARIVQRDGWGDAVLGAASDVVSGVRDFAADAIGGAGRAVGDAASGAWETASGVANDVKKAVSGGVSGINGPAKSSDSIAPLVRAKLASQINTQVPGKAGIIGELNDLDNFRETNDVPETVPSFSGISPSVLTAQITEKTFAISQLEATRTNIVKKTRADARLAVENAKKDLGVAVFAPGAFSPIVGFVAASMAISGGSLAMLGALCAGIIAEHNIMTKLRDNLKLSVEKSKNDLRIINTTIAFENKKLAAMKKAAEESANPPEPRDLGEIDSPEPRDLGEIDSPEP
jgi:hypothetical protein